MDDGFNFWPLLLNFEHLKTSFNNMYTFIKVLEKAKYVYENGTPIQD